MNMALKIVKVINISWEKMNSMRKPQIAITLPCCSMVFTCRQRLYFPNPSPWNKVWEMNSRPILECSFTHIFRCEQSYSQIQTYNIHNIINLLHSSRSTIIKREMEY